MIQKFQIRKKFTFLKFSSYVKFLLGYMKCSFCFFLQSSPFCTRLIYFISLSFAGLFALKTLKPKDLTNKPKDLDLFFMSASAVTVSSMSTVEMESFTDAQSWVLTFLMLIGGEVFTSMLGLQFMKVKLSRENSIDGRFISNESDVEFAISEDIIDKKRTIKCMSCLVHVVLGYLTVVNVAGSVSVLIYLTVVKQAGNLLKAKGIKLSTFSVFTTVSSFGNCGFTPANENMALFSTNSLLLLIIIPQILAGNTLYPPLLSFSIWVLKKFTRKEEYGYILQHPHDVRYKHLFSSEACVYLSMTVLGFILVQTIVFCGLEWDSEVLMGMNWYQKIVGSIFLSVNSRHAGESVVDLSKLSSAVLVLFAVMMYLPPYTSYVPITNNAETFSGESSKGTKNKDRKMENLIFSQLTYLVIFVLLICLTERESMRTDPLNFNVFNIVFEVISAYGNVGFSIGYSCKKLLKLDQTCIDASYGFVGKWSPKGKLLLIIVMIFGRLKKFNKQGGKAWKLS
ncbi:Cation transporter HKT1 [Rhynchospora pubera]|uniref:Cation transporter HKT1 n=1 Tax=Rhynchospora pubera TaxID=906938 RepID=A0AAV8CUI5_9POAL|nr:Cation transporter HKT1 [Rhynchospora pubera]